MVRKTLTEVEKYKESMRELSRHRDFRARFRSIKKQEPRVTDQQLAELNLNTQGSGRAKAERLFRAIIKTIGGVELPWYPENDESQRIVVPEEDELVMEPSEIVQGSETDTENSRKQRRGSWPINKGLPSTLDIAAASGGVQNVVPPSGTTTSKQRTSFEQSGGQRSPG